MTFSEMKVKAAAYGFTGVVFAVIGTAVVVGVGECRAHVERNKAIVAPVVAPPTKMEARAEVKVVPCVDVRAIEPKKRDRTRIAKEYRRPDLAAPPSSKVAEGAPRPPEILGEREIPKLPEGGKALIVLETDGSTTLTTVANPEKFFSVSPTYEIGAIGGSGTAGDARWRAWAAVEPLRVGRIHLRVEGGVESRAGASDAYVMVGGVWRSR